MRIIYNLKNVLYFLCAAGIAACNTKPPTLLCVQKPAAEKYICYRPSVYTSGIGPNRQFNVHWNGCSEYNECDNIESMVGQKCYVKIAYFGDTEILKGPIHPNTMASVELMDLDMYKKEGLAYKVNPKEAIWGSSSGYPGDSELQLQLSKAMQDGSLDGYTDLSHPCRKNYKPGLFPEVNDIEESYEIARESEFSCGANPFRTSGVCVASEVFTELCSGVESVMYSVDAISGYDMLNGRPGREIYLKAKICDYNPAKKYEVQITFKDIYTNQVQKIGEAIRLGYDPNLIHIKKKEPKGEPAAGSTVVFTIQAFVSHPSYVPGTIKTATMDVVLKETTANLVLANGQITVRNSYYYNKVEHQKRELNVYIGKNPIAPSSDIRTYSYKGKSFQNYFQKAYTEEAHILGNFQEIDLPDYLIDNDGYAVLLLHDTVNAEFEVQWLYAIEQWRRRCLQYLYLKMNNQISAVTLQSLDADKLKERLYYNAALLTVVKTGRLYQLNGNTLSDVTYSFLFDKGASTYYQKYLALFAPQGSGIYGITNAHARADVFNPMSIVFRDPIQSHYASAFDGTVIKVGLHELVHAWNFTGTIGTTGSNCVNHGEYIFGDNMKHCMFKCPHDPKAVEKMSFSKGLVQRMLNVMAITY